MAKLYLYLARLDNRGIKLLTVFENKPDYPASRIKDITLLHLPQAFSEKLKDSITQYGRDYDVWIESAVNFEDLKTKLKKRGYTNLYYSLPLHPFEYESTYNTAAPDLKRVRPIYKTMVQKITP